MIHTAIQLPASHYQQEKAQYRIGKKAANAISAQPSKSSQECEQRKERILNSEGGETTDPIAGLTAGHFRKLDKEACEMP